jgi:tripartite-type tricarboxylate transporter receptor subunit TctC
MTGDRGSMTAHETSPLRTGVSKAIPDVLIPSLENVFKNPEVVQRAKKAGFSVEYRGPEEFRKMIEYEIETIEKVAKFAGLKKE